MAPEGASAGVAEMAAEEEVAAVAAMEEEVAEMAVVAMVETRDDSAERGKGPRQMTNLAALVDKRTSETSAFDDTCPENN